jgi:histone H2A
MAKAKKAGSSKAESVPSTSSARETNKENINDNAPAIFAARKIISKKNPRSLSKKSGLTMPALDTLKKLKRGNYADKIQKGAAVYCTGVIEYLVVEILELAGNAAHDNKKRRIIPRHIQLAVRNDTELAQIFQGITISQGGVMPYVHAVLLPKKTKKRSR